jgi:hypothetical protein
MRGRRVADERGVAMIEATIGTVLLVLAALIVIQLVLVFHGSLALHGAVARAARTMAITGSEPLAEETFIEQKSTALGAIKWRFKRCGWKDDKAQCEAGVDIPVVFPGAGMFGGGGLTGPIHRDMTGSYPKGRVGG